MAEYTSTQAIKLNHRNLFSHKPLGQNFNFKVNFFLKNKFKWTLIKITFWISKIGTIMTSKKNSIIHRCLLKLAAKMILKNQKG
jgi:hypothetical protein